MPRVNKYGLVEYPSNITWNARNVQPNLGNYYAYQGGKEIDAPRTAPRSNQGWLGPVLGAAVGIGQSIWNSAQQRRENRREREARREEAEKAHQRDIEMWERQNEYNHPANQQARFAEAGLNPHLMYGQGDPGNATQMPHYNPANLQYGDPPLADLTTALDGYLATSQRSVELKIARERHEVQKAQRALTWAQETGVFQQNVIRAIETSIASHIMNPSDWDSNELKKIAEGRIAGMKADNFLRVATNQIKEWEAGLTEANINPRDSVEMRYLVDIFMAMGFTPEKMREYLGGVGQWLMNIFNEYTNN